LSKPYRQRGWLREATMLAELFMLHLEARLRTPREPTSLTKSDTRFVPIKHPVPEKEGNPQTHK
jgi:hypothetical protein